MRPYALLLPLLLAGCWHGRRAAASENDLTLCVENATAGYGNVIARAELTRIDVMPGQTVCKRVSPASVRVVLTAVTTSGGAAGPLRYSIDLPSAAPGCWRWRLGNSQATQADLVPCAGDPMTP
jgi:hypothetical protein